MITKKPFLICLTGGVASGKTTVSDKLFEQGFEVVDTDVVARDVVAKNSKGLNQLVSIFGAGILNEDGLLDRMRLRRKVFSDASMLKQLNGVLHPLIHQNVLLKMAECKNKVMVVVIPLYSGQKEYDFFDRVLVVDVEEGVQLNRLMQRDGVSKSLANHMLVSQISRGQRLTLADDVISNKDGIEGLLERVEKLVAYYHLFTEVNNVTCQSSKISYNANPL